MGISPNTHAGFSFNYAVADSGAVGGFYQATNVGNNAAANPYVLAANSADVTFTILTNNQATATGHGEITFELLPGAGYKLGATTETQTTILDLQAPTIEVPTIELQEDGMERSFRITSNNRASGSTINVSYSIDTTASSATSGTDFALKATAGGDGITSGSFVLADGSANTNLYLQSVNDAERESTETIVITFTSPEGVFFNQLHTFSQTFNIIDNDTLRVSVTGPSHKVEGEEFNVRFSITPLPREAESIMVNYTVTNVGTNNYLKTSNFQPVNLTKDVSTFDITLETNENVATDANGEITILVNSGTDYIPASTTPHRVIIQDKDLIPKVTIRRTTPATMEEGGKVKFELVTESPVTSQDITARVAITRGENFLATNFERMKTVDIKSSNNKGEFEIMTEADVIDHANDEIIADCSS